MTLEREPKGSRDRSLAQFGLLAAIPGLLIGAPLVGFFIGRWADGRLDTEPWLSLVGTVAGLGSAGLETYRIIKKAERLDERKPQ